MKKAQVFDASRIATRIPVQANPHITDAQRFSRLSWRAQTVYLLAIRQLDAERNIYATDPDDFAYLIAPNHAGVALLIEAIIRELWAAGLIYVPELADGVYRVHFYDHALIPPLGQII
jgi:hypothetical protein